MKRWMLYASIPAVLATTGLAHARELQPQGLVKVNPIDPKDQDAALDEAAPEQAEGWRSRLTDRDLDRRETAFAELLQEARRAPALIAQLETWAGDGSDSELSWTSRLLLRELKRSGWMLGPRALRFGPGGADWPQGFDPSTAFDGLPFDGQGGQWDAQDWNAWIERFREQDPFHGLPGEAPVPQGGGAARQSMRIEMQSGPDGVDVKIHREENGETKTEEHHAASLEELLEAHPELREHLSPEPRSWTGRMRGLGGFGPEAFQFHIRPLDMGGFTFGGRLRTLDAPRSVRTDILGVVVRELSAGERSAQGLPEDRGARVERVEAGTIAQALGIQRGHVLVEVNGRAISSRDDIKAALDERGESGEVRVKLLDQRGQQRTRIWTPEAGAEDGEPALPAPPSPDKGKKI